MQLNYPTRNLIYNYVHTPVYTYIYVYVYISVCVCVNDVMPGQLWAIQNTKEGSHKPFHVSNTLKAVT